MYSYRSFCLFFSFSSYFMVANFLISGKLSGFGQQRASTLLGGGKIISGSQKVLVSLFFFLVFFTSWLYPSLLL